MTTQEPRPLRVVHTPIRQQEHGREVKVELDLTDSHSTTLTLTNVEALRLQLQLAHYLAEHLTQEDLDQVDAQFGGCR